ncbi:hypothetical protein EGW08_012125 [Elysia chlorotica]|uniref:Phospholipid scramblase n=1 Tax=Elysia chlorotica TaxID=188477 RepID=A0A3S1BBD2_ELYCH|nr:hypothetical protein EGW08_012125 [Elysia chlorotica]
MAQQGQVFSQPGQQYGVEKGQYGQQDMQMNPYPVVVQPGMAPQGGMMGHPGQGGVMMQQPGVMMQVPPNVVIPAGLPPGLAYLAGLSEVKVHQILELAEVLVGWERNNKYDICNSQGQKFMFAKEDTDCCTRQFCGVARPFQMNISDNMGQPLMALDRPFRCQGSACWCCCLQEMEIQSPPGVVQGTVKEVWTCWTPKYKVYNAQNQVVFTIVGECCYCKCCTDVLFHVFEGDGDGGQEICSIVKHWGGCREVFGGANDFTINFPSDMDLMRKMLLFGATFLIDFNYFEYNRN